MSVLDDQGVHESVRMPWQESHPGTQDAHEEGGFILRNPDGSLVVQRWPRGMRNEIFVPPHSDCKRGLLAIVATFHTHPNPGLEFLQEPSLTDIRAVRDDPHLKHAEYEGEYVIGAEAVHVILKNGEVELVGKTKEVLNIM